MQRPPPAPISRARLWVEWFIAPTLLSAGVLASLEFGYLTFHTLAEAVSIVVGLMAMTVALSAYRLTRNHYLTFLGIALGWCAFVDVLHSLSYTGMGIFVGPGNADIPSLGPELWVVARFLQALSLCLAPWFLSRPLPVWRVQAGFAAYVLLGVWLVFSDRFPEAFIAGQGQTPFKIYAEYVIIAMLAVALAGLWRNRALMSPRMFRGVGAAIIAVIASEFFFTLYVSQYAVSNAAGHILKIYASWFIFLAVVQATLRDPFSALSRAAGTYDAVPDPVVVVGREGRIVQVNRAAEVMAGLSLNEIAGRAAHALLHDAALGEQDCGICRRLAAGERRFREALRRGDRMYECSIAPYSATSGLHVQLFTDITTLRDQSDRLALEARRVQGLLELTRTPADTPEVDLIQAGLELARTLTGSTVAFGHMVRDGSDIADVVACSPGTADGISGSVAERYQPFAGAGMRADCLRGKAPVVVNEAAGAGRGVAVPLTEAGAVRMVTEVFGKPGNYSDTDVETLRLISEAIWRTLQRRRAEQSLVLSEGRLRTLFDAIPDPVWLKDAEGVFLACNAAFERLYGAAERQIVGRQDADFVDREQADFFRRHDRMALAAGKPLVNEEWLTFAADGRRFLSETTKVAVHVPGRGVVGVLGIARDITEARNLAEERERLLSQLSERLKESTCLYDIARLLEGAQSDLRAELDAIAVRLRGAFRDPARVEVMISGELGEHGVRELRGPGLERALRSGGRVLGTLRVQYPDEQRPAEEIFLAEESRLLDLVAAQITAAYERVEARSRLAFLTRLYDTLSAVNRAIVFANGESELLDGLFRAVVEKSGLAVVAVLRGRPGTPPVGIAHAHGIGEEVQNAIAARLAAADGPLAAHLDELLAGRVVPCNPAGMIAGLPAGECLLAPLMQAGSPMATLLICGGSGGFTSEHARLVEQIASDVSFALEATLVDSRRREAEAGLSASEARFARMLDTSPVPMVILDMPTGRVRSINDALQRWLGYSLEEVPTLEQWFERVYPDPALREQVRSLWMGAIRQTARDQAPAYSPELRLRRKDGAEVIARGATVLVGQDALVAWQDLTEIRRGEAALRESEQRFRSMIEQAVSGIYVRRGEQLLYVNPSLARMLGYEQEEMLRRPATSFVAPEPGEHDRLAEIRAALDAGADTASGTFRLVHRDGHVVDAQVHLRHVDWADGPATIAMVEDVTERRRAESRVRQHIEELQKVMRGTTEVVSRMVELRDPYTAGHERRVGLIARDIARELGWSEERCDTVETIGLIHDLGQIAVPAEVLTRPGPLSPLERELMQSHAEHGYEILSDVPFTGPVAEAVRQHHERLDGSGYPRGLKGEQILPEARLIAVADVLEAMNAHRPYRPARGMQAALEELEGGSGVKYDPEMVRALLRMVRDKGYVVPD